MLRRAGRELFGSGLDTGDRGAQLVRRVDQKSPGGRLGASGGVGGLPGAALGGLQRPQHPVEGAGRAAELGVGPRRTQSPAAVTGGDVGRQRSEPAQWPQRDPADGQ